MTTDASIERGGEPSVAGVDLPDGTRVRVVLEGVVEGAGKASGGYLMLDDHDDGPYLRQCVSVVAVPAVPEPGRWYSGPSGAVGIGIAGGYVSFWDGRNFGSTKDFSHFGALVECSAPPEFTGSPE